MYFLGPYIGKSCSEIKYHSPKIPDGSYIIDPDGEGGFEPFTVFCDMTDKNGVGVTVIGHDSEARMHVNGYEERGSYVRHIHYLGAGIASVAQIAVITDYSLRAVYQIRMPRFSTFVHGLYIWLVGLT